MTTVTTSATSPVVPRSKSWVFTWNNYTEDYEDLMKTALAAVGANKFVWQREEGEEGTPHIQGCVQFTSQKTSTAWQPRFNSALGAILHYEVCRKWKESCRYCSKEDTAVGGSFSNMPLYVRVPPMDLFDLSVAPQWQKDILDLVTAPPNNRAIYWVWEPVGGVGKTTLARHLAIKYPVSKPKPVLVMSGKAGDMQFALAKLAEGGIEPRMIIWDLPRSRTVPDFAGLEEIKNGLFFSTKYESGQVLLKVFPHIVVFSNHPPDLERMSADRWVVWYVGPPLPANHPIFVNVPG